MPAPILLTERLILREWRESDVDMFASLSADPEVMEYLQLADRAASDALALRIRDHFVKHGFGFWAVEIPGQVPFIGFVGLMVTRYQAHFTPSVEIGWRLGREHWGKGYATEAAKASLDFGFRTLALSEIVATTVPLNRRSRAVMDRLGMTQSTGDDFDHPLVPAEHSLKRSILYRLSHERWTGQTGLSELKVTDRVVIRRAILADAPAMVRFVETLRAEKLDTISQQPAPTLAEEKDFIKKAEKRERAFFLLALSGVEVVGLLDLWAGERVYNRHAAKFGVSVANGWRGRGVGRKLVQAAIAETKKWEGFCRLELEVAPWNAVAIHLYEAMGFTIEGRRLKALNLRGTPEDDFLMAFVW
jgi:RimJ/RimL family protein N-acetyltransferase